ncbi:hypothetical protein ACFQWB_09240 [Paenibacillus thermoaerophilus]|uniref:Uncharacterized protein n=1 Tax=Paenibacillus thermoaerophilus TaxID=1215385 RepID=A0ABW2V5R8_9BACL|nr:hypothetical protein [Paenibacillus thermoaerophilus]TMV10996.1 hypothetical protein FE781_13855 [Paenibacillus thermoaerophilus]
MSKQEPAWYERLKGDLPPGKTLPIKLVRQIERKAAELDARPARKRPAWLLPVLSAAALAVCLFAAVLIPERWRPNSGIAGPAATAVPNPFAPFANRGEAGGWELSAEQAQRYNAFKADKDDEKLRGLQPIDLFLFYVNASLDGDYDTLYALYIQGKEAATPPREEFLSEIANDPDGAKRAQDQWEQWKRTYRLDQRIDGDSALIVLTPEGSSPQAGSGLSIREDQKGFGLTKNESGIWKVNWLPMQ